MRGQVGFLEDEWEEVYRFLVAALVSVGGKNLWRIRGWDGWACGEGGVTGRAGEYGRKCWGGI